MVDNITSPPGRPAALLADPVIDPDPTLSVGRRRSPDSPGVVPVVTPADCQRAQVAALRARIAHLEDRLTAAERRRIHTIDRYESILDRRTETFRRWVAQGDPRPEAFEWVGRSERVTADPEPPGPSGTAGATESEGAPAVATDGGRTATDEGTTRGILDRFVDRIRLLVD